MDEPEEMNNVMMVVALFGAENLDLKWIAHAKVSSTGLSWLWLKDEIYGSN